MSLPAKIWHHISTFVPLSDLKELYAVNQAFFDISMNARYRELRFEQLNKFVFHQLESLRNREIASRVRSFHLSPRVIRDQLELEYENEEAAALRLQETQKPPSRLRRIARRLFGRFNRPDEDEHRGSNDSTRTTPILDAISNVIPLMTNVQHYSVKWSRFDDFSAPYAGLVWQLFSSNVVDLELAISASQASQLMTMLSVPIPQLESLAIDLLIDTPFLKCQVALGRLVSAVRGTLKKLRVHSNPFLPLSTLFSHMPELPRLVDLQICISGPGMHMDDVALALVKRQAAHLQKLYLSSFKLGFSQAKTSFCLDEVVMPYLHSLDIVPELLNCPEAQLSTFFSTHASTLKHFCIQGFWPMDGPQTVLESLGHRNPHHSLTRLSLYIPFQAKVLDRLATIFFRLDSLWLRIGKVSSNSQDTQVIPSDSFPDINFVLESQSSHFLLQDMGQYESFERWKLRNIMIKRYSCCGDLILWGLMRLCAHYIPSITSFAENGDTLIPDPPNLKPRRGPATCSDVFCRYGKDN
ncbi:unnamed protein product [Cyclocybe aegerita]|uniref:F-box domain-containing protein n=1 Tax=Cyclocybe aegerita TaxID=1973307 RepID=A0A8S0VTA4_CYCAE|nr:unnamed protein product [Cyclocybe aegerita]